MDYTKMGRLAAKELDSTSELLAQALHRKPHMAVGFIMCPINISERVGGSLRSEARVCSQNITKTSSQFKNFAGFFSAKFSQISFALEVRRIEDKLDAKKLTNALVTVRMTEQPAVKKVPLVFQGWVVWADSSNNTNIFRNCGLVTHKTPKKLVGWQPESSYVVPSAQPEALPHSAEGTRRDGTN